MVTIREESCREPESRLCGTQKAIPALLNLSAPFITTTLVERAGEELQRRQKLWIQKAKSVFQ